MFFEIDIGLRFNKEVTMSEFDTILIEMAEMHRKL
jgi:hypothetical protein